MGITGPKRFILPLAGGVAGAIGLSVVYLSIVSLAEGPQHALELFVDDWRLVLPIILGFGVQAALYTVLKKRLYVSAADSGPSGKIMGAGGATSTAAMVACCAHHVTDVLPILGLSAASAFLAEYRIPFMIVGLMMNLIGIVVMSAIILRERRRAAAAASVAPNAQPAD